jgi:hypothetical protein
MILLLLLLMVSSHHGLQLDPLSQEQPECNRTFSGEIGIKYPLRLSEPSQRFHAFYCDLNFVPPESHALSGQRNIIELTFLSFQIGSFEVSKDPNLMCPNGHLTIRESSKASKQKSFTTRNIFADHPNTNDDKKRLLTSNPGRFCGQMVSRKAIYYSEGRNLSLGVYLPPGRAFYGHSLPFSLFLTYRFLPPTILTSQLTTSQVDPSASGSVSFGTKVAQSYCDRVFDDCFPPKKCKIRSPHYPGFYPRNITCQYRISESTQVPPGYTTRIVISQVSRESQSTLELSLLFVHFLFEVA